MFLKTLQRILGNKVTTKIRNNKGFFKKLPFPLSFAQIGLVRSCRADFTHFRSSKNAFLTLIFFETKTYL